MGEKVEGAKNDGEKKAGGDAGQKKDDNGAITSVFKIDMHCEGCAKKLKRAVKHLDGVSDVKADPSSSKLTVIGKVDPAVIKTKLEQKTNKKIVIVSPQPKKDGGGDKKPDEKTEKKTDEKAAEKKTAEKAAEKKTAEKAAEKKADGKGEEKKADGKSEKKSDEKAEKKPEEKKSDDKKAKESTVVLKMRLHCEGCIQKIRKALIKFKGVNEISVDAQKDLITVKGTIEGKDLASYLKDKFKRSVEVVVPPKKEEPAAAGSAGGGDKKEKEPGGDKKESDGKAAAASSTGDGGGAKLEMNRFEYNGFQYQPSTFYYDAPVHSQSQYGYSMEAPPSYPVHGFANSSGYYANDQNYVHQGYPMSMYDQSHAPQMFSDENPNSCSVM